MLNCAINAARQAGAILLDAGKQPTELSVTKKGIGDYVTQVDLACEKEIIRIIRNSFPGHQIIAEESGMQRKDSPYQWIIDPLDGTANFVHNLGIFGVSIACMKDEQLILGVIYSPATSELFWAEKGKGAFLNGRPIHVSKTDVFSEAMIATGFPWRSRDLIDPYLAAFKDVLLKSAGMRRMGAAAIDLAYTACGRFEGFWEIHLKPWDVAAGAIIIEEAGGIISSLSKTGTVLDGSVVAGNRNIHDCLCSSITQHLGDIV